MVKITSAEDNAKVEAIASNTINIMTQLLQFQIFLSQMETECGEVAQIMTKKVHGSGQMEV